MQTPTKRPNENPLTDLLTTIRSGDNYDYDDIVVRLTDAAAGKTSVTADEADMMCEIAEALTDGFNAKTGHSPVEAGIAMLCNVYFPQDYTVRIANVMTRCMKKENAQKCADRLETRIDGRFYLNSMELCAVSGASGRLAAIAPFYKACAQSEIAPYVCEDLRDTLDMMPPDIGLYAEQMACGLGFLSYFAASKDEDVADEAKECLRRHLKSNFAREQENPSVAKQIADVKKRLE